MIKKLFTLLLSIISINSYCCDCKTISKETEYRNSDFIFLGKIISVNDKFFEIETLEVFKGKTIRKIKSYISDCSIYPNKGEIWLLYSKKNSKNAFFISACGNSRSFSKPFTINYTNLPPPPPLDIPEACNDLNGKNYFKIALLQLELDIAKLRQIRSQNKFIVLTNNYQSLQNQIKLLKLITVSIIIFVLFLIFRWRKIR
ncbi:hypothetical protein [Flavobacterium daemonense]|uniref:hypothetical protein n=1 Tax=Flavobacterium daemonense TaxID=1393049 RepID=UPI0011861282|nr:hypothetical protein [Flavobacterium daemonense]KAF2331986.1 hypothetical protein FND99_13195 [Flavobacterium daemonense]